MVSDDLRMAARHALRRPLFALGVTAALAVSIGAATTAFGLGRAVLWRPLPFVDASRLVFVWEESERDGQRQPTRVTGSRHAAWRDVHSPPFSSMALFGAAAFTLDSPAGAESIHGVRVSSGYFDTLGIRAALGRTFLPADEMPGSHRVVVLSHQFWQERVGGRYDAIGSSLRLSGERYDIVGVMPPAVYPGWPVNPAIVTLDRDSHQVWVPIARTPQLDQSSRAHVFGVVARLGAGISDARASEVLTRATDPAAADAHHARVVPLRGQFVDKARAPLGMLVGAAVAVLLVACGNLAALFVSGFEARRAEFALRAAVGASSARLLRQLALEAAVPAALGGGIGLAAARVALAVLPEFVPSTVPVLTAPGVDVPVVLFAIGLTAVGYVAFIGWPVVRLLRSGPAPRGVVDGNRGGVYRGLVVSQVALGMMLVTIAGLLGRSLRSVEDRDTGFGVENVLVGNVVLPLPNRPDARRVIAAERALFEAVRSAPGVLAVASAYDHPLEANWSETPTIVGDNVAPEKRQAAELRIVSPGYFETLGVAVREGRSFSERDDFDAPGAVIVNELFARQLGGGVIGRRIRTATPRFLYGNSAPDEYQIVGVVDNERFRGLESPAQPAFYLSTRQFPQAAFSLLVKSSGEPLSLQDEVRAAIHATDRGITFSRQTSLTAILGQQLAERRVTTSVIGGFAGAALALAALGLYGLLTIFVASRTREMGVRVALGASPATVALGVLQLSVRNSGIGIGLGAVLSLAAGRLVGGLLVDVSPNDPTTLAVVAATFLSVSLAAAWIPAVRAARTDPVQALRA